MKLLLDESLPVRLKQEFRWYQVKTVYEMGWAGKKDSELLKLASEKFDVFLTADRNIQHQQNIKKLAIAVIALAGRTNRYNDLKPLVPKVISLLKDIEPGKFLLASK